MAYLGVKIKSSLSVVYYPHTVHYTANSDVISRVHLSRIWTIDLSGISVDALTTWPSRLSYDNIGAWVLHRSSMQKSRYLCNWCIYTFISTLSSSSSRPDTSQRQLRWLPPCTLVVALVPSKCPSRNLQFPQRVPFTWEKMPECPCPVKKQKHTGQIIKDLRPWPPHPQIVMGRTPGVDAIT